MKYEFNKLKMENILKFIEKRGYYYIQTKKLYDHFTGPKYIGLPLIRILRKSIRD